MTWMSRWPAARRAGGCGPTAALALLLALALLGGGLALPPPTRAATSYSCDEAGLKAALLAGGAATFACAGPTTVTLQRPLQLERDQAADLDGGGLLTISGGGQRTVLYNLGTLTLRHLTVTGGSSANYGGGIRSFGPLTLIGVTVSGNTAAWGGGGVYADSSQAPLTVIDSTVSGNTVSTDGPSTFDGGGGIYSGGSLTLTNSTVSGNTAANNGGGIYSGGNLTLTNSTISSNAAVANGGGIFVAASEATLTNGTVAGNTAGRGGALFFQGFSHATLQATIVAAPAGGSTCDQQSNGGVRDYGRNLETGTACRLGSSGRSNTDPLLGPLRDNGGPTLTHLPGAGSPAIRFVPAYYCPLGDQRGAARPTNADCTAGAVEVGVPAIVVTPDSLPAGTVGVAYGQQLAAAGGTAPYTYTVAAGALPAGLTLTAGGLLAGTPTAGGTVAFTVRATGGGGYGGIRDYTLTLAPAAIAVAPATLPGATVDQAYSRTLTASGGTAPYTFAVTAGALPAGLTLAADGTLSGTPTAGGSFTFTATATDSSTGTGPYSGAQPYTLAVARGAQTITFGTPAGAPAYAVGDTFTVGATASSGLAVTFSASGACTIDGTTVTANYAGTCTVTASQPGDANYTAAPDVARTFPVGKRAQMITFATPAGSPSYTVGDTFTVGATASSGLPVTFAAGPSGVCTISGTTVMTTGAGTCTVTAGQPGDATYAAAPDVARTFPVAAAPAPRATVRASAQGDGTITPAGDTTYATGAQATYTATPTAGQLFLGWTLDGRNVGFASPLTFTVSADRSLVARFAPRPSFADVAQSGAQWDAIMQLAARGVIKGYRDGTFGPTDTVLRAQIAAFLVRAFGWDTSQPSGAAPFGDLGGVDPELQRAIAILAQRGIARGYGDGTYDPTGEVTHAQAISLIARSMVQAGYWTPVTSAEDDGTIYPNVPRASDHRLDLLTFVKYSSGIPDRPTGQAWADWEGPASRGWTAQVLWQALGSYFGVDRVP